MSHYLDYMFRPESIAIIGASNDPGKRGYQSISSLLRDEFSGKLFPINRREKSILGLPAFEKIEDVDDAIDLALIATPAGTVPGVLRECAKKKVKAAVILAIGFGEVGEAGKKLQDDILAIGRTYGIRIVGPNTSGLFNLHHRMNLTGIRDVPKGSMAILSQSGNMTLSLITEMSAKSATGFSAYVGVGNEADIQFHEYLDYFKNDPTTNIIVMFVDGMRDGRAFLQVAKDTVEKKPIVLLRSGRSEKGRKAAHSHTGALAGLSIVSQSAFSRAGVITIEHSDELYPAAESLANLKPLHRNRIAVISDGGGHSALAADALSDYKLALPDLSVETQSKLKKILPTVHTIENPLDLAGASDTNPAVFADCADILMRDPDVDAVMLVGLFGGYHIRFSESLLKIEEETAQRLNKIRHETLKPLVVHSLYAAQSPPPLRLLKGEGIPVHESIDIAAKCLSVLDEYGHHLSISHDRTDFVLRSEGKSLPAVHKIFDRAVEERGGVLLETEAREVLGLHGIPVSPFEFAASEDQAVESAKRIGYPVVMKIVSPDIIHKSEVGGVLLNIKNDDAVRDGFDLLVARARRHNPNARVHGALVTPMMPQGTEVVVGVTRDPQFGPVIMFGLGGIMVEVLKDVSFRVLPLGQFGAPSMLNEIHARAILNGVRGKPPVDKEAIVRLLMQVSDFVEAYHDRILDMDLNPVVVYERGLSVVDARMIIRPRSS